jgi:hypothetical protein
VDPTSFCHQRFSQVTGLERGQVSVKITHRQRFRQHLRFIKKKKKHRGTTGFDICVVRPQGETTPRPQTPKGHHPGECVATLDWFTCSPLPHSLGSHPDQNVNWLPGIGRESVHATRCYNCLCERGTVLQEVGGGGGTWPSSQRGALASRRSQVRIPAEAVN